MGVVLMLVAFAMLTTWRLAPPNLHRTLLRFPILTPSQSLLGSAARLPLSPRQLLPASENLWPRQSRCSAFPL